MDTSNLKSAQEGSRTSNLVSVALISAPRRQVPFPARPARLFSASEFFTLALTVAERTTAATFILSPHHGLLRPTGPPLAPYHEETLDDWPPARRHAWADRVLARLLPYLAPGALCTFYAGRATRAELQHKLTQSGYRCEAPLAGLDPDAQLVRLRELATAD